MIISITTLKIPAPDIDDRIFLGEIDCFTETSPTLVPHLEQKLTPSGNSIPHFEQYIIGYF